MSPLVLLGLLTFFFTIALSFALWSALTLGDAARRHQAAGERPARKPAADRHARPERQPNPFEATQPRPNPALRVNQPQPISARQAQTEAKSSASNDEERVAQVVVTPRKANDDAFERFLESEKRRD